MASGEGRQTAAVRFEHRAKRRVVWRRYAKPPAFAVDVAREIVDLERAILGDVVRHL
ncbi:MAG TPA: hypothetical protein VFE41_14605 [Acetobacteraceae bacterium]|jgi:hypothetical protein|nr:hypothetical protein [Acetobacteraceae bacterium]